MAGWLVGWMVGWLVGWLVGLLAGWFVDWLVGRLLRSGMPMHAGFHFKSMSTESAGGEPR